MDRHFLGVEWLASQVQAVNALLILLYIPLFRCAPPNPNPNPSPNLILLYIPLFRCAPPNPNPNPNPNP